MDKIYDIVTMPNGLKMMAILPIINAGAEAYATIRDNAFLGKSKGEAGPFSANLYKKLSDEELANGQKDFRTACQAMGISDRQVITNRLTATTNIVRRVDSQDLENFDIYDEKACPRADGLITNDRNISLFNYAADCCIGFMYDPKLEICGSNHASWRCSLKGIFQNQIQAFVDMGSNVKDIIVVLAPSIGVNNYSLGEESVQQFIAAGYGDFIDFINFPKPHANLPELNRHILLTCGISEKNLYVIDDQDTYSNPEYWHSYRRSPVDERGRHLNGQNGYFIKLK
jgi:hypothetical protein